MRLELLICLCIGLTLPDGIFSHINLDKFWCSACNDPHMHTFDGLNYEYQFPGDFHVLFTDFSQITVTGSFRPCNKGRNKPTCNCATHLRYGDSIIFIDGCGKALNPLSQLFYFVEYPNNPTVSYINCHGKLIPKGKETNDAWWATPGNAAKTPSGKLSCAKSAYYRNTIFLRTNDADDKNNVFVKVLLGDTGISCIYVRPSFYSFGNSGGLCGFFNGLSDDDRYIKVPDAANNCFKNQKANETDMSVFWRLDRDNALQVPTLTLNPNICPCDPSSTVTLPAGGTGPFIPPKDTCSVSLAQCICSSFNFQCDDKDYIRDALISPITEDAARLRCQNLFLWAKFDQLLKDKLISREFFNILTENCIIDQSSTGDSNWVITQLQMAYNVALESCLNSTSTLCSTLTLPVECVFLGF